MTPPAQAALSSLEPVLAGEFALQAGQLDQAADWYLQAAQAEPDDAGLAERATRIAMLGNDDGRAGKALALWRQRAPEALPMRGAEAALSLREGALSRAKKQLRALLADTDEEGWRFALLALAGSGDPQVSAKVLKALVKADAIPQRLEIWQGLGRLALRMDDRALSGQLVDEVVRRFPDEPRVALLRASQLNQDGQGEQARALLRTVETQVGDDLDLRQALALTYGSVDAPADAARVLAVGPQNVDSYMLRASLLAGQHDQAGLQALYAELKRDGADPQPEQRLLLGKIAEFLQLYPEAVQWYQGVAGGELRGEARLRAANAMFLMGQSQQALQQVHSLQNDADSDDDARRNAYLLEAQLQQQAGDATAELEAYARGLAEFQDDPELLYARALAWEQRDDIARAEADLRRILISEPENVAALNALGYTLADRTGRYKEALALIERARIAEPDNPSIIDSYGWVLHRLGRDREALQQLRRAWALFKDPEVAVHMAEVLWTSGQQAEAREFFEQARQLEPDNRSLQRAIQELGL